MDIDKGFKKIIKNIELLSNIEIEVGIFDPEIAEYAIYNEEGTRNKDGSVDIPKRSFFESTYEQNDGWKKPIEFVHSRVLQGEDPIRSASKFVGEVAVKDIKNKISSNIQPPNAVSTIKRKGSSRTLIDTGAMRNAVTYRINIK